MRIAQAAISLLVVNPAAWGADWAWGLPLIVLTVVIHVTGLGLIKQRVVHVSSGIMQRRHSTAVFVAIMGARCCWSLACTGSRQASGLPPTSFLALYLADLGPRCSIH